MDEFSLAKLNFVYKLVLKCSKPACFIQAIPRLCTGCMQAEGRLYPCCIEGSKSPYSFNNNNFCTVPPGLMKRFAGAGIPIL